MPFTIATFEQALVEALSTLPMAAAADGDDDEDDHTRRPRPLCVALSGGLDSSVLLVACADLARDHPRHRWTVRSIHVDHRLHADSARWSDASQQLAWSLDVPIDVVRVDDAQPAPGESPEAVARDARYAALRARLEPGAVLLTAHHADDQLETVLLQWLRGGGLRAVAGMPPLAPLGDRAWHARPLLGFERHELEAFARERGLTWVTDPSNDDLRYDRNYLRHAVLPTLRRRWPAAPRTVGRVAAYAREALQLEREVAARDLAAAARGVTLDVATLHGLPEARQCLVLRAWLVALGLPVPPAGTLAALRRDVRLAAPDRNPYTAWADVAVHRYRGRLHAVRRAHDDEPRRAEGDWPPAASSSYAWTPSSSVALEPGIGAGLSRARLPARLRVAARRGGEAFRPAGSTHRRPLRKWLQEHDVLPWRREDLPLLLDAGGRVVAVADLACAHEYAAQPDEPSWRVTWHGRGEVTEADALARRWPEHPTIG